MPFFHFSCLPFNKYGFLSFLFSAFLALRFPDFPWQYVLSPTSSTFLLPSLSFSFHPYLSISIFSFCSFFCFLSLLLPSLTPPPPCPPFATCKTYWRMKPFFSRLVYTINHFTSTWGGILTSLIKTYGFLRTWSLPVKLWRLLVTQIWSFIENSVFRLNFKFQRS